MIGIAIREARERKNMSQKDLSETSFLSYKTISAIETGRRGVTKESLKFICKELEDPRVYIEAVNEVCDGVFSLQWLNGDAADLHRSSVKEKTIEELSEALEAVKLTKSYKNPEFCDTADIEIVKKSIQEIIDVYIASAIYIAINCKDHNLNIKEMFRIQKEKLIFKKYLKKEPSAKGTL